jgi:16S rRNA processing protein RimM
MRPTAQAAGKRVSDKQTPLGAKETKGDFITLARVVKTHGRHGEVAAEVHSDVPDRFAVGMKLFALPMAGSARQNSTTRTEVSQERRSLELEDLWPHKGLLVMKFASVDSMNDAEALIGSELQVPKAERARLADGWTYVSDLIGCTVLDHGREIGRIADVQFGAGEAPLLVVSGEEKIKFDIPFAEAYLECVVAERREVRLKLPEGMLDINASMTAEEKKQQARQGEKKTH